MIRIITKEAKKGNFRSHSIINYQPVVKKYSNFIKPSPPKYEKSYNFIASSLDYIKKVDKYQKDLQKSPNQNKIEELMRKIEDKPELLYLLSVFHQELNKIGINQDTRKTSNFKYKLHYFLRLGKLHSNFWELCQLVDISSHNHKLKLNQEDIGLLDPKNFSKEDYEQLKTGIYKETSFKEFGSMFFRWPTYKKK